MAHPAYDAFWQARAVQRGSRRPRSPTLTVGGWWDQEDRYGPLATYRRSSGATPATGTRS